MYHLHIYFVYHLHIYLLQTKFPASWQDNLRSSILPATSQLHENKRVTESGHPNDVFPDSLGLS